MRHARSPSRLRGAIGRAAARPLPAKTPELENLLALVRERLNTVCQSAACPNLGECWSHGTATFMIGGNLCTRACGFCDVKTGRPAALDPDEPARVAGAVARLGLRFAVVTAVARDDLEDGGAAHFARTIQEIRARAPGCRIEVLIPDLKGWSMRPRGVGRAARRAEPQPRNRRAPASRCARPTLRSLARRAANSAGSSEILTKTGLMLARRDRGRIRQRSPTSAHGCRLLTIGQYLAPSGEHLPVARWVLPTS
jgi:lipoic acid synthetase